MTQHRDKALDHLAAVEAMKDRLDAVRAEPGSAGRSRRIEAFSAELRLGMKLALIHAVLDVGDAFRDWTRLADEPIAEPAELVVLEGLEDREAERLVTCYTTGPDHQDAHLERDDCALPEHVGQVEEAKA